MVTKKLKFHCVWRDVVYITDNNKNLIRTVEMSSRWEAEEFAADINSLQLPNVIAKQDVLKREWYSYIPLNKENQ